MKRELINKTISNIIETVKFLDWKLTVMWVQDNRIYGEVIKKNGERIIEALYVGAEDGTPGDIYDILYLLRMNLDFQDLLIDDDIM